MINLKVLLNLLYTQKTKKLSFENTFIYLTGNYSFFAGNEEK